MAYLESSSWCSRQEYIANQNQRVMPTCLMVDEVYTLMLAVKSRKESYQAARKPSRVMKIDQAENGLHTVTFEILSDDFEVEAKALGKLPNGIWADAKGQLSIGAPDDWHPVTEGYFKDYENGLDDEWRRICSGLELGELALTGV